MKRSKCLTVTLDALRSNRCLIQFPVIIPNSCSHSAVDEGTQPQTELYVQSPIQITESVCLRKTLPVDLM